MALATYNDLLLSVASWLNRDDLAVVIPDFIALAEKRLNRRLRVPIMEQSTSLATVAGVETVALPSDFLEMRALYVDLSPDVPMVGRSLAGLIQAFPDDSVRTPSAFAISGTNLHVRPIPSAVFTLKLVYYAEISALSVSNQTNAMLTKNPDAYLYASLMEAAPYLQEDGRVNTWGGLLEASLGDIEKAGEAALWSSPNLNQGVDLT